MDWGEELFDKYDELLKHFVNSIEFLEHFSRMIQDRVKFELEYAKNIKKMPSKNQLKRKDDYGGPPLSYEESFEDSLKSIKSIGLQHESIADNLRQNVNEPVMKYIQEMKKKKTHFQNEYKKLERTVNQSLQCLDAAFQRYRRAHLEMLRAEEAYKVAEDNRNLARAEVDRQKAISEAKKSECDNMKGSYATQLETTNKTRQNYYHSALPNLLKEMQDEDKKRTEEFSRLLQCAVEAESTVMSTVTSCHNDILKAAQSISWNGDNQKMVENMRSGHSKPEEMPFADLDKVSAAGSNDSLTTSITSSTIRKKEKRSVGPGFLKPFVGNKKPKEAENFSHLGPEQQKKKLNEKISETRSEISKVWTELESLRKLKTTFKDKSNECQAIQVQIKEKESRHEKLQQELDVLEGYLREATGSDTSNGRISQVSSSEASSRPTSVRRPPSQTPNVSSRSDDFSDDEFGPPPVDAKVKSQPQQQPQEPQQLTFIGGCTAVYDFANDTGDGLSMRQGEQFYVVARDSGDGWTLVSSLDSTQQGYVPSGYINIQFY